MIYFNEISPEEIIYVLLQRGKITIETAIKFHMKELTLEEIIKLIKKDESLGDK